LWAGVAVAAAGVEHDGPDDAVLGGLLAPQHRVGLAAVRGEDRRGVVPRPVVDDEGDILPTAALQPGDDAGGPEASGTGGAHGATPTVVRPRVSEMPSARFIDWTAPPAVPLVRLSIAPTTTS